MKAFDRIEEDLMMATPLDGVKFVLQIVGFYDHKNEARYEGRVILRMVGARGAHDVIMLSCFAGSPAGARAELVRLCRDLTDAVCKHQDVYECVKCTLQHCIGCNKRIAADDQRDTIKPIATRCPTCR